MTLIEERKLAEAKAQLKTVSGSTGDERQVWLEDGDRMYWYLFEKRGAHWVAVDSATYASASVRDDTKWPTARALRR